jgi:iron complex transport system permease protein
MLSAGSQRRRAFAILATLALLALLSIAASCMIGSVGMSPRDLWQSGAGSLGASVLELRLHRALAAFATGAMLSLAGVMMQALLRNPLADPYVLGVSGGAAVGALAVMLFFGAAWMVDLAAFAGAIVVALLLYVLARRDLRGAIADGSNSLLLLTGVVVASGCGALVTLMLSMAPDGRLRSMVFWLIGDLSGSEPRPVLWLVLVAALLFALRGARSINLMALHADAAATLGVRVGALRKGLFLTAALLTAAAVSSAGSIGFVGLIVPHACRFACGPDHRVLIPAATLAGGTFLVLADTLARTAIAPQQLPVGVVTALIGTPVFLYQLHRLNRK